MKLKPIATTFDPNFIPDRQMSHEQSNKLFERLCIAVLPYANLARKIGVGTLMITLKLMPQRAVATLAATLYNTTHSVSEEYALETLNVFNAFIATSDNKITSGLTAEAMLQEDVPSYLVDLVLALIKVEDVKALRDYMQTIRDLALPSIPSLWESESV